MKTKILGSRIGCREPGAEGKWATRMLHCKAAAGRDFTLDPPACSAHCPQADFLRLRIRNILNFLMLRFA